MTEREWREAVRPAELVEFVFFDAPVSDRRLRLFSCACARRVQHMTGDDAFARLIGSAEAYADKELEADALWAQNDICKERYQEIHRDRPPPEVTFACGAVLQCGCRAGERKR